ncbi:external alternative NAD(P)H-ubiquinone oxidoreductase B3, mitochondrial-like isoform X2 [Chenopodium quinoa]|uniref:external alternative NAD(P)H-ubiquinone oxidoreductase B3, mitochondrial-like isoform X2 n=1 Tax=Chenopodium quinoa TaxID=63459 RepID=UPI000B77697C|nr:external alternative NAD(P)H-ubiquinone oxidoreductase B3, mitochondrial-like isoform X2 [Chenopodium quinoa]
MKNLPATAQVAAQQGTYLADCFNRMEECEKNPEGPIRIRGEGQHRFKPFRHRHFGQFAPLGAAAQLPGDWVSIGHSTRWLWYSVYARLEIPSFFRKFFISNSQLEESFSNVGPILCCFMDTKKDMNLRHLERVLAREEEVKERAIVH